MSVRNSWLASQIENQFGGSQALGYNRTRMSASGYSRPRCPAPVSNNVRFAPKATKLLRRGE